MKKLMKFFRFKKRDLSPYTYISDKVDEIRIENGFDEVTVKKSNDPIWIPSKSSAIKLGIVFLILALTVKIGSPISIKFLHLISGSNNNMTLVSLINSIPTISGESATFQNLLAINTGIGAVLIGLAFFVAQSLMDREDPDKAKVLLYKSKFFPLLASEVLVFFLLMIGEVNYLIIGIVVLLGIFTIHSLGETIRILVRTNELEKAKSTVFFDILKDNFIEILNHEIRRRQSNNILSKFLNDYSKKEDIKIVLSPYFSPNNSLYLTLYANKEGHYSDINLIKFEEMIKFINKYSFNDLGIEPDFISDNNPQSITYSTDDSSLILHSKLYTELKVGAPLLSIKKDFTDSNPKVKKYIQKNLASIFIIEDSINLEENTKFEITKLKERCINFIKEEQTSELKNSLKVYEDLLIEFYKFIETYGLSSKNQAGIERNAFFPDRIKPLDWISSDTWKIFEEGMKSNDKNIIKQVAYLPIMLSKSAIKYNNHMIFQSYIHYLVCLYIYGYRRKSNSDIAISKFMIDRSWRYITELIDYYLIPYYKQEKGLSWEDFQDFAKYIIKTFQGLIKNSYDNKDNDNYILFIEKMSASFDSIRYADYKEALFLSNLKQQSLFGLGSWILFNIITKGEKSEKHYLLSLIQYLPTNIVELTNLFIEVSSESVQEEWEWLNWEFSIQKEKEPFWSVTSSNLKNFYTFLIVKSAKNYSDESLMNMVLPATDEFALSIDSGSGLINLLENIKNNKDNWEGLLSMEELNQIDSLKSLLYRTKERYEEKERELIRGARISSEKVNIFKENFRKNIKDSFGIKDIYKKYDRWKLLEVPNDVELSNGKSFGIHTYFEKTPFLSDNILPHVSYLGFDEAFDFGKAFVRGESSFIINSLSEKLDVLELNDNSNILNDFEIDEDFIIISVNDAAFYQFDRYSEDYIQNWTAEFESIHIKDKDNLSGVYKLDDFNIPVYDIYTQDEEMMLILLNTNHMGTICQYVLNDIEENNQVGEYLISIKEIIKDSELEKDILSNNPPIWLSEEGQKSSTLQEKVIIKITEKIDFKIEGKVTGAILYVENNR